MPEISAVHIAIVAATTVVGVIVGWLMRGNRADAEKAAVSRGWQDQINAQRLEHDRLTDQNKGLMEQISQYQASNMDAKNRAKELAEAVQEAYARRDQLQREIKDIRSNLEISMNERQQLQSDISAKQGEAVDTHKKDMQIANLQAELENWQNRLPPLIEKFRQKTHEAETLQTDLLEARDRITALEDLAEASQTRIEAVSDPDELTDGRGASNEPIAEDSDLIDPNELTSDMDNETDLSDADQDVNGARDQLQAIKGVGPAIEKTLNEMGIFRFQQIAEMGEYDIDRVAQRLKGFRSRIYREDWIGQARELRDQSPGG